MTTMDSPTNTVLTLLEQQLRDVSGPRPASLPEALGMIHQQLHYIHAALGEDEYDAETLLQELVRLTAIAVAASADFILREINND